MKVHCKHCGRYLFETAGTVVIQSLVCPNSKCKARLNFKIINHNTSELDQKSKFTAPETRPK